MDSSIFSLVDAKDVARLWQDLAQARAEIMCKGDAETIVKIKAHYFTPKSELECLTEGTQHLKEKEEYLGHFFLGGEKYYFKARAQIIGTKVIIALPKELYHLQRRQNYRARFPASYPGTCTIKSLNEQPQKIKWKLFDISSQGCRVILEDSNFLIKIGDKISGSVDTRNTTSIEFQGVVRHIKNENDAHVIKTFGMEFTPITPIVENKLFALTMEIHKEFMKKRP